MDDEEAADVLSSNTAQEKGYESMNELVTLFFLLEPPPGLEPGTA